MISHRINIFALLCCLLILVGCTSSKLEYDNPQNSVSIAYLKSLCHSTSHYIDEDIVISGRVTANDWLGEYYKSIVIEDNSGGIEIAIDRHSIYNDIPIDCRITVLCCGLALGRSGGKIELGMRPTGEYSVDNIDGSLLDNFIIVDKSPQKSEITKLTIDQIETRHISCTVQIEGLQITEPHCDTWCENLSDKGIDTEHIATDKSGRQLKIRVRGGCEYANAPIPKGRFTVCGIIDYAADAFYLRPTNKSIVAE